MVVYCGTFVQIYYFREKYLRSYFCINYTKNEETELERQGSVWHMKLFVR